MAEQTVVCPNCGKRIPVTKTLSAEIEKRVRKELEKAARQFEKHTRAEYEQKLADELETARDQGRKDAEASATAETGKLQQKLKTAERELKANQKQFDKRLAQESSRLEKDAKREARRAVSKDLTALGKQIRERDKTIEQLEELEEEYEAQRADLEARERKLKKTLSREVARAKRDAKRETTESLEREYESELLKKEKRLSDVRKQVTHLKKQMEQSSQQLQGEVFELHLERMLREAFPEDEIEEVAKGRHGADVVQRVYSPSGNYAGTIIWESKDTKKFYKSWLTKLKRDQRREKAEIAVLASTAFPKGLQTRFGLVDGVWVTDFGHVVALGTALRANLIQVNSIKLASEGKEERLEVIFQYLTGVEFKHRVEAIVEAFVDMQNDLSRERVAAERSWSKREKQMQAVLQNVAGMYGEIQGIAGKTLPRIKRLALPSPEGTEE